MKKVLIRTEELTIVSLIINAILVVALIFGILLFALNKLGLTLDFMSLMIYKERIVDGFLMTIALSIASLIASLTIGILAAVGSYSSIIIIQFICHLYVKVIRGTPLIAQIYLFYYIIGTAFGVSNRFLSGIIILSVFEGAYIAEILRGSFLSIEKTQLEIADSVGFTKMQTIGYVVIPQLVARTLPSLTGQFASIIKDSSLLSIIAVIEVTQTMREITATNFQFFEAYLLLSGLYLLLTLPLSYVSERLERKYNYANRI
ncbi:MAG: amino acid ABC transporter permease [Eubacteriales bacterium]